MKQFVSLVILSIIIISLSCFVEAKEVEKREQVASFPQNAIAIVNEDVISDAELKERLNAVYKNVKEITSGSIKKALDDLINRRLIIQEAYRMGLDQDPLIIEDRNKFLRIQSVIRFRRDFIRETTVTKDEILKEIIERYEKRDVELLLFENVERASEVFSLVLNGQELESFKEEATYWKGAILRRSYGASSLLTEAIFSSEEGRLLFVKAKEGVYVIRVLRVIDVPPETQEQFAPSIERKLRDTKSKRALDAFLDEFQEKAILEINYDFLRELDSEELLKGEDWHLDPRVLGTINGEPITVGLFLQKYKAYLPRQKRGEYTPIERNERAMEITIRTTLEAQAALARNYYEKSADLRKLVEKHLERAVLNLFYQKVIQPRIDLSVEELKKYYRENIEIFSGQDRVAIKVIVVEDKEKADDIYKELQKGANINYLSDQFSLPHPYNGWKTSTDLPEAIAKEVGELEVGKISKVIPLGKDFFIVKVVGREKGKPYPFPSVHRAVKRRYIKWKGRELLKELAMVLREGSTIKINTALLTELEKSFQERKPEEGPTL